MKNLKPSFCAYCLDVGRVAQEILSLKKSIPLALAIPPTPSSRYTTSEANG